MFGRRMGGWEPCCVVSQVPNCEGSPPLEVDLSVGAPDPGHPASVMRNYLGLMELRAAVRFWARHLKARKAR